MSTLTHVFMSVLNMSITGAVVTAAVIMLRVPLRRAPGRLLYALWIVVLFRLVCPISFTADFSLLNGLPTASGGSAVTYVASQAQGGEESEVAPKYAPAASTGTLSHDTSAPAVSGAGQQTTEAAVPLRAENIAALTWLCGAAALALQGVLSWARLKRRLAAAVRTEADVYETDAVDSPFVLGILRPRIYVPAGLKGMTRTVVLAHERTHIARRDTLVKPLAFAVRCMHWFNPMVWLAFKLMSRDMERSCDERAIRESGFDRGVYSMALLQFALPGRLAASPLAFGEVGVKQRIRGIMNARKPALWLIVAAVIVCAAAGVICLANPANGEKEDYAAQLAALRTPYIGDNSAVGALLDALELPEGMYVDSFQLQTGQPPYQLTIYYGYQGETPAEHSDLEADYFANSALIMSLVGNADIVRHVGQWSNRELSGHYFDYTHTREDAQAYLDADLAEYGQSARGVERLLALLEDKADAYVVQSPAPDSAASAVRQSAYAQVYAMGDTLFADLDGDGKEEEIYYGADDLRIDGVSFKADIADVELNVPSRDVFLVTDIDTADGQRELALRCDGPSQDPQTFFYAWKQGRLFALGGVPCHTDDLDASFDGRGTVNGAMRLSVLQTWWASAQWSLNAGTISLVPQAAYSTGNCPAILETALPIYARAGDMEPSATLTPQAVTLTATDNEAWVEISGADGVHGWFRVQDYDWLPDIEMSADEAFGGLSAAD